MNAPLRIENLTPAEIAAAFEKLGFTVTEDQITTIAEQAEIIGPDGTINLIKYAAHLAKGESHGQI